MSAVEGIGLVNGKYHFVCNKLGLIIVFMVIMSVSQSYLLTSVDKK